MFPPLPIFLLLTGGLLLSSLQLSGAEEYYVTPTQPPNPACPSGKPCHTLNDYAKNASFLFSGKDDVSLLFLDGIHDLSDSLEITNTTNVTIAGVNVSTIRVDPRIENWIISVYIFRMENISLEGFYYNNSNLHIASISLEGVQIVTQNNLVAVKFYFDIVGTAEVYMINSTYYQSKIGISQCSDQLGTCFNTSVKWTIKGSRINCSDVGIVLSGHVRGRPNLHPVPLDAEVVDTTFTGCIDNFAIPKLTLFLYTNSHLSIQDSCFTKNNTLVIISQGVHSDITLMLKNVSFIENTQDALISPQLYLVGLTNTTIDSCYFEGNVGYPSFFVALSAYIMFKGNTTFVNNVGWRGGAMNVYRSLMYFELSTNITFINNRATDVGGAIYYEGDRSSFGNMEGNGIDNKCFFQLAFENIMPCNITNHLVYFINNSAQSGGDNIYGGSIFEQCFISTAYMYNWTARNRIFYFDNTSISSLSSVSSDPLRVCLCENGVPKCANYSYIVQERRYTSGEKFNLSVVITGSDFGTVSGGVYATFASSDNSMLGHGQNLQRVEYSNNCSEVEYSVHSRNRDWYLLILSAQTGSALNFKDPNLFRELRTSIYIFNTQGIIKNDLLTTPIFINITILPCPLGFKLKGDLPTCLCADKLGIAAINNCTVINGTGRVYRSGTVWVSHSNYSDDIGTDGVLVHKFCPYDYCKVDDIAVDLYDPDTQCAFNHNGILCGGCPSNLSLALGSSQCLPCTNDGHIALLIFFITAGFALVFFIKILDLTVARGTINGLIFYGNIIWINQSIFFPSGDLKINPASLRVLKVFVAWLNLDFGIETCFFHGLDAYWKTWLQFVFPIYVWIIAGVIILICHYSPKATRLFGNNTVPLLATLFLISYVKLLRTIATALGFAILDYPDGAKIVWLFDGNVPYFGLRHSFLFVVASLALLVLWFPYTATLLLVPCLRKKADHYLLRWVNNWKPFYDAYYGPLKDNHQYWIGGTLLVRVVLAVLSVVIQAIAPNINVLLVAVVSALLFSIVTHVYNNVLKALLEASFLVNLVVFTGAFLYINTEKTLNTFYQENRIALVSASVGISFITFLGIVIFHAYSGIKKLCCNHRAEYEDIDNAPRVRQVTQSVVAVNNEIRDGDEFREPLLESELDKY